MSTTPLSKIPEWIEWVVNVISYVAVAWTVAAAASWIGKDNWIVAIAMGLAAAYLLERIAPQYRQFFRGIIMAVFEALVELVEFLGTWLREAAQQGFSSIVQAIVRVLTLAALMWIWNLAQSIPAIKALIDLIVETSAKVIKFVNTTFDGFLQLIDGLRLQVRGWVDNVLQGLGDLGQALRSDILGIVDRLFSGIKAEVQQLRFELLGRLDVLRDVLRTEVEVLGVKVRLLPEEVRTYLLARFFAAQAEHVAQVDAGYGATALPPPPPSVAGVAPWLVVEVALAEIVADQTGLASVEGAQGDELEQLLREALGKIPALVRGPYERAVNDLLRDYNALARSTSVYATGAIEDLRAVLAGRPPVIPDWPPEFSTPPSTHPL